MGRRRSCGIGILPATALALLIPLCLHAQEFDTKYAPDPSPYKDQFLFGDWGGLRQTWHNNGVDLNLEATNDTFGILHGGISDQVASWPRIRGTLDIDFAKLTHHTHGLTFHATALWQTGVDIGAKLGSLNDPSSLPSAHTFRLDSFYFQWRSERAGLRLRAGQMAGYDYYSNSEYGASYLNLTEGYAFSDLNQNTYLSYNPAGTPAAEIYWQPLIRQHSWTRSLYLRTAVFSGNRDEYKQDPTGLHFVLTNSGVSASEIGYRVQAPEESSETLPRDRKVYPGLYKFGAIVNNGTFTDPLTGAPMLGNHLLYLQASQAIFRTHAGSNQGVDVSFGWDHSSSDVAEQHAQWVGGIKYNSPFFHRAADSAAFGFVSTRIDPLFAAASALAGSPLLTHEDMYELNYRAQLRPYLALQPVFDYYADVGGRPSQRSATLLGFRIYLRL
jgi:porin